MPRIISIDYGKKRTGIAVTDPLQIIAGSLTTIPTSDVLSFLKSYLEKEQVELFVIGEPYQTNGKPSENLNRVKLFSENLKKEFSNIPIVFYDERYTSVIAKQTILSSGINKKARQNKWLADGISATIILQDYLNSIQNKTR